MPARSWVTEVLAFLFSFGRIFPAFPKPTRPEVRRLILCGTLAACFCLFAMTPCRAQITNVTDDQARPIPGSSHSYIHFLAETVNPANGSVSLRIQPPVAPGRKLTIPFSFGYDSSGMWHMSDLGAGNAGWMTGGASPYSNGWSYIVPSLVYQEETRSQTIGQPPETTTFTCAYTTDFVFQDPNGTPHALGLAQAEQGGNCGQLSPPLISVTDGGDDVVKAHTANWPSGNTGPSNPVTVADPDGTVYYFQASSNPQSNRWLPDYIEDRNGNKITVANNGNGSFTFTDTVGRTLVHTDSFHKYAQETVTVSNRSYVVNWNLSSPYSFNYTYGVDPTKVSTAGNCNAPTAVSGTQEGISSILLPNGKSFSFSYDPTYGLIDKVTYPSGGFVKYTWGDLLPKNCTKVRYDFGTKGRQGDAEAEVFGSRNYRSDTPSGRGADVYRGSA